MKVKVSSFNEENWGAMPRADIEDIMRESIHEELMEEIRFVNLKEKPISQKLEDEGFTAPTIVSAGYFESKGKKFVDTIKTDVAWDDIFDINYFLKPSGKGVKITSPEGNTVAEWINEKNTLLILFDLCKNTSHDAIFKHIIKEWLNIYFDGKNIDEIIKEKEEKKRREELDKFVNNMKEGIEKQKRENENKIKRYENDIEYFKSEITNRCRNMELLRKQVPTFEDTLNDIEKRIRDEFALIEKLDKVKNVKFENGLLVIFTDVLYAYTEDDDRYYMGEYKCTVNLRNSEVNYYLVNDEGRRGCWTSHDPHPHVDGGYGVPCLGNVSSTIAELCGQIQLYPLATILLDFLQSVNTKDYAGAYVVNWDKVNEDGDIIQKGGESINLDEDVAVCADCGEEFDTEEGEYCTQCDELLCVDCLKHDDEGDIYCCDCIDEYGTFYDEDEEEL